MLEKVQLSKFSQSKNGGAYFSAVCGSNLVPNSATEAHKHRVWYRLLGFFLSRSLFCFPEVCRAQSSFSRVFVLTPGRKYDCKLREIQLENGVLKKWTNWWGSWVCSGCDLGWLAWVVGVSGASPHGAESNGVWCIGGCESFFILLKSCFEHGKLLGNKKK